MKNGQKNFLRIVGCREEANARCPGTNLSSTLYLLCGLGQVTYSLSAFFICKSREIKICRKAIKRIN